MAENIEMIRPINLPEAQQLSENDVFILDSETGGVRKIPKNKVYTPVDDTLSESGEAADAKVTGEKIDELKAETALIQNPIGNKSGELVSFSDGADMPAKSVIVNITPKQSGSGTPSPENVRPISGWDEVGVSVNGINQWDEEWTNGRWAGNNGVLNPAFTTYVACKNKIPIKPSTTYYFCIDENPSVSREIVWYDINGNWISDATTFYYNNTFTSPNNAHYMTFNLGGAYGTTYNHDISINYPSTDHDYHAYTGTNTPVNLGRTVYGGTLDVVSGVLTAYPFYPSYNGETLNGRWICDRAVYAEGTTPPTGSQVALISGTGTTYQLTPTEISTLLGENNVWADSGDVEITYRRDINIVIDELTNAIVSLGSNV